MKCKRFVICWLINIFQQSGIKSNMKLQKHRTKSHTFSRNTTSITTMWRSEMFGDRWKEERTYFFEFNWWCCCLEIDINLYRALHCCCMYEQVSEENVNSSEMWKLAPSTRKKNISKFISVGSYLSFFFSLVLCSSATGNSF